MKQQTGLVLLRVFLPFAAGYFLSYLYRVVNAVLATELTSDLMIGPSALGLLTATYFISFASFQLPLGILLDRYGPRRMEALLLLFAAAGAVVFSRAQSLLWLIVGRALIGFGVSACLMAAFKAYTVWFPRQKWPLVNGFQMASGGLGALAATAPVEAMLGCTDWRGVFLLLAVVTLLVAGLVFVVVPEQEHTVPPEPLSAQLEGVRHVFSSIEFWRVAPLTTMSQAAFLAIQSLWAGPWLRDVAGMSRAESASVLFWVAVCMIVGWITLGSLTERLGRRGVPILTTAVVGMSCFMVVQLGLLVCPVSWATSVWFIYGYFGTTGILAYAGMSQVFPVKMSGRVTTALNLLVFLTAFVAQWAIGAVIGLWPLNPDGSYSESGFVAGFAIMLMLQFLGLIWYLMVGKVIKRNVGGIV